MRYLPYSTEISINPWSIIAYNWILWDGDTPFNLEPLLSLPKAAKKITVGYSITILYLMQ